MSPDNLLLEENTQVSVAEVRRMVRFVKDGKFIGDLKSKFPVEKELLTREDLQEQVSHYSRLTALFSAIYEEIYLK